MVAERIGEGLAIELVREGRAMTLDLVPRELRPEPSIDAGHG